jgi:hypothetical protein
VASREAPVPEALRIVSPPDGATYLIDPTLRVEFQALSLRAVSPAGGAVTWSVDGKTIARAGSGELVSWPLVRGRHRIVARDARGLTAAREISVR